MNLVLTKMTICAFLVLQEGNNNKRTKQRDRASKARIDMYKTDRGVFKEVSLETLKNNRIPH